MKSKPKPLILSIIILMTITITGCSDTSAPSSVSASTNFSESQSTLDIIEDTSKVPAEIWMPGLAQYSADLEQYGVYFIGEGHANIKTYETEIEFIRYFYSVHGVRDFMLEMGYCDAALLNEYLKDGDRSILESNMAANAGSSDYNRERLDFIEDIRTFYLSLPENDRFMLHGIDLQWHYGIGLDYLKSFIQEDTPNEIKAVTERLWNELVVGEQEALSRLNGILSLMESNTKLFADYFGGKLDAYTETINSLIQGINTVGNDEYYGEYREQSITDNFFSIYNKTSGKLAVIYGSWHTDLSGWPNEWTYNNMAQNIVGQIGTGENGLTSICLVYDNSYTLTNEGERLLDTDAGRALAERTNGETAFFSITTEDDDEAVRILAKGYQYAVSISNSPAATPYD